MDAEVYKGFKKMRKKLGKKVLAGQDDRGRGPRQLGRQFAQKGADEPQEAVQKAAAALHAEPHVPTPGVTLTPPAAVANRCSRTLPLRLPPVAPIDPEVIKAAVTEATSELRGPARQAAGRPFTTKLAEQQRVIDAIADQPDPSTAAFSGLAFNPLRTNKAARPAGVATQAEIAERTQHMVMRTLQDKYNSSSDPTEREAYYTTLSTDEGVFRALAP